MYWERDQEITLLWAVLENLHAQDDRSNADGIICGLIEMDLVDMDRAPVAQQAWNDEWDGFDVTRDFVAKHYKTPEEIEDEDSV